MHRTHRYIIVVRSVRPRTPGGENVCTRTSARGTRQREAAHARLCGDEDARQPARPALPPTSARRPVGSLPPRAGSAAIRARRDEMAGGRGGRPPPPPQRGPRAVVGRGPTDRASVHSKFTASSQRAELALARPTILRALRTRGRPTVRGPRAHTGAARGPTRRGTTPGANAARVPPRRRPRPRARWRVRAQFVRQWRTAWRRVSLRAHLLRGRRTQAVAARRGGRARQPRSVRVSWAQVHVTCCAHAAKRHRPASGFSRPAFAAWVRALRTRTSAAPRREPDATRSAARRRNTKKHASPGVLRPV
jgi:hypothetical protein